MTNLLDLSHSIVARGEELSDMQLGLLLADLQLDAGITTNRGLYRAVLAHAARAERTAADSERQAA